MFSFDLPDAAATRAFGERLGRHLPLGTVLLLAGDLGAGKTTLTQGLATGLGVTDTVGSPTFSLIAEYPGRRGALYHADLYRLKDAADVESTGLLDYLDRDDGLMVVEWFDRWPDWPETAVTVTLEHRGSSRRAHLADSPLWAEVPGLVRDAAGH